jgi:hypothetical protein
MHTDTVKDPFSAIVSMYYASTPAIKCIPHHKSLQEITTSMGAPVHVLEDTTSQFQKALAASSQPSGIMR